MRQLIIIRTHRFDDRVRALLARYREVRGADVVIGMDERVGPVETGDAPKVGIDDATLDRLGLYRHPKSGWQCGDYVHYAVRAAMPDYDFYWLLEPDLEICARDLNSFFDHFAAVPDDLLAANFGPRSRTAGKPGAAEGAGWATLMAGQYDTVYGCLFPITRLSARAVDHLARKRAAAHPGDAPKAKDTWPNDEAFVCTEAMAAGLACSDFNDHGRKVYDPQAGFTSWRRKQDLYLLGVSKGFVEGLFYHPVLTVPEYVGALVKDYRAHTGEFVHFAGRLGEAFDAGRMLATLEDEVAGAAQRTGRARLTKEGWSEDAFLLGLRGAGTPGERMGMQRLLRRTTPASGVGMLVHQPVLTNNRTGEFAPATPEDFGLGPPIDIDYFPRRRATAYCLATGRRELLFVGTYNGRALLEAPFLCAAQAAAARHVIRVPWDRLANLYPAPDAQAVPPTLIFSIGGCGSTLLSFLCGAHGAVSASEPEVFSQMALFTRRPNARKAGAAKPPEAARFAPALLHATLRSVQDYAGQEEVAVKLRTAANRGAALIAGAFPRGNFVFVFREIQGWARSHVESFNRPPQQLCSVLAEGIAAYDVLRKAGVRCSTIWYEEMARDPEAALRAIYGERPLGDAARAELARIMGRDSQAGTSISRSGRAERAAKPEVAETVAAFLKLWQRERPAELIEAYGLPY